MPLKVTDSSQTVVHALVHTAEDATVKSQMGAKVESIAATTDDSNRSVTHAQQQRRQQPSIRLPVRFRYIAHISRLGSNSRITNQGMRWIDCSDLSVVSLYGTVVETVPCPVCSFHKEVELALEFLN